MAEIINLRRVRKRKEKAEHNAKADQNRLLFGRSKAERKQTEAEEALKVRQIDGHKRDGKTEE